MMITADHGNAEMMIDPVTGGTHTYHTTLPVPLILALPDENMLGLRQGGSLRDIAPTLLGIAGIPVPAEMSPKVTALEVWMAMRPPPPALFPEPPTAETMPSLLTTSPSRRMAPPEPPPSRAEPLVVKPSAPMVLLRVNVSLTVSLIAPPPSWGPLSFCQSCPALPMFVGIRNEP